MLTLKLYGYLAREFGTEFRLHVSSLPAAIRLMEANFPGRFCRAIRSGEFHVIRGGLESGIDLDESLLGVRFNHHEAHLIPAIGGAKSRKGKGFLQLVLGVALIAVTIFFPPAGGAANAAYFSVAGIEVTASTVALFGASLAIQGVANLIAPTPKIGSGAHEPVDQRPSFLFNGPVNVVEQGHPVPLVYGQFMAGSVVISSGLDAQEVS